MGWQPHSVTPCRPNKYSLTALYMHRGHNSWLCTWKISTIVSPWRNTIMCEFLCRKYLRKSSINIRCPPLRTAAWYLSKLKKISGLKQAGKWPTTAWKIICKNWLWVNVTYPCDVETHLPWRCLGPHGRWFWCKVHKQERCGAPHKCPSNIVSWDYRLDSFKNWGSPWSGTK